MPRLPDRFDLWVRKARVSADPERQIDWVLGALVARQELYFLNAGTTEQPTICQVQPASEGASKDFFAIVFTDAERHEQFCEARRDEKYPVKFSKMIVSPTAAALDWCVERQIGLLINYWISETVLVPPDTLAAFVAEWKQRGGRQAAGFWIPNLTNEEEDFWQENGL
jgi:hypothetical protein